MSTRDMPRAAGAELKEHDRIGELIADGALLVINHSAGKDSQAQTLQVIKHLRAAGAGGQQLLQRVLIMHAEWPGVLYRAG